MHTPCLSACLPQMDHWRLDEDESGWEDDRQEKQRMQQAEAARLHAESAEFYQLARATREHKVTAPMPPPKVAPLGAAADKGPAADKRKRPAAGLPAFKVHKKEATAATVPLAAAAGRAPPAPVVEQPAASGGLPGMDAYGDDDSD